ncbi:Protein O-mannosyl-transferase tmtc1 [Bulinus truncatus]|nr:Protein O-mannosyl-transferase tmtc1 [Bulinus truncatus]
MANSLKYSKSESIKVIYGKHKNFEFWYSIPISLVFLCFFNCLHGEFVHDDVFAIQHNRDVTGESEIWDIFYNDFWGVSMRNNASHKSYRPLCVLSFRLDYYLSGGDSRWFHAVNLILHALVVLLLAKVCRRVLNMSSVDTVLATSLFAVHPIHTEAVTGIVGRADVLAAVFFLMSFTVYARSIDHRPEQLRDINYNLSANVQHGVTCLSTRHVLLLATSMVLAAAAMLTKETGVTVLGVNLAYDVSMNWRALRSSCRLQWSSVPPSTKQLVARLVLTTITAFILLIMRMAVMNFEKPTFRLEDNPASFSSSFVTRVLTFNYVACYNIWLLLCPSLLCYDWTGGSIPLVESVMDHRNLYTVLMLTATSYLCWRTIHQMYEDVNTANRDHGVLMSLACMVIPFVPASNLFFRVGFVIAERILYIPSIGYCILIALGLSKIRSTLPRLRVGLSVIYLALLVVMATKTYQRNQVWESRDSLFRSGVKDLPQNAKTHYNMGNLLKDMDDKPGAEYHYRQAIRLNPHHPSYYSNLGAVLNNATKAKECYFAALKILPGHKTSLFNLGRILIDEGNNSGINLVHRSLAIDPNFVEALIVMGKALLKQEHYSEAGGYFKRALNLSPSRPDVRFAYGYYLHMTNNLDGALQEYQQVLSLDPNELTTMQNIAKIYTDRGDYAEGEKILKKSLLVKSDCDECLNALGSLYLKMGQTTEAVISLERGAALAPNNIKIHLTYVRALKENKQSQEAKKHLQELLAKLPNDFLVVWFAYNYSMAENRLTDAEKYISDAISLAEHNNDVLLSYLYKEQGDIYRLQTDLDKALKFYEKSLEIDPENEESIVNVGSIHFLKKNYTKAESYYMRALEMNPQNLLARINLDKLRGNIRQPQVIHKG